MTQEEKLLFESNRNRINRIMEYTVPKYSGVDEAGDDDNAPADGGAPADPSMGGAPAGGADPSMGGAAGGADPSMGGADPSMGGAPAGGADPSMGGNPMDSAMGGDAPAGPEGFNPQDAAADPSMGGNPMDPSMGGAPEDGGVGPDDDVVDISDLTDSQEETKEEVDKMDDRFDKALKAIGALEALVKSNNDKVEDLKAEFEKRNPTQIEKLSMQTAKSYPFSQTPEEYWKEKEATSNYSTEDDDNGKEQGQYVITKKDVDGDVNWKAISDSLDDDDFMYHQNLKDVMKY